MNRYRTHLEKSLIHFSSLLQESVFAEETALRKGWLQPVDPRVKVAGTFLLILSVSFSHSIIGIVTILVLAGILAADLGAPKRLASTGRSTRKSRRHFSFDSFRFFFT